ncbi:hypothetical protein EDB92DRAFT_922497 [Lactarius akahatsu]|uniref:Zn(2)-C6 fungal-type domain-containing protein n=1 Tax=Lactarius akahatsu TaxID=416441 RepID=A0AAD4LPG8_9AGAM|nr:hypothetical protein EDB92DRAFT_922497 [Lactarius akahatsu]
MKRPREDSSDTPSPSGLNSAATERPSAKRNKASRACTSCRKHKTRCELFEPSSHHSRCHRCDVLSIACSFETNAPSNPLVNSTPNTVTNARRHVFKPAFSAPGQGTNKCDEPTCEPTQSELLGSTPRSNMVSPWEFHKVPGIPDWTAAPMLAMLTLSKMVASKDRPTVWPGTNPVFTEVLSGDQRRHLLSLFESRYVPWLSLPPNALGNDPVLDLICCTIASRHLEQSIREAIFPSLRKLTEEAIVGHVFNPAPSPAIIQAFALLALWSPFDGFSPSSSETHDSRLIAAAAINMCSSLRFDQAATDEQVLTERHKLGAELTPQEAALLTAAEQRKLLWMCVHNIESLVCLGTGRGISSKITDNMLGSIYPLKFSTLEDARRTRMLISTKIFNLAEAGLRMEISEDHDNFETYCDESAQMLYRFDGLQRVVTSVHVVTDIEVFYSHMLVVYFYFCRLAFVLHTLHHMRIHLPTFNAPCGSVALFSSKPPRTGRGFALTCARDALASAESLLTTILSIADTELLATAPDSVYAMISFAAAYLTSAKYLLLHSRGMRHLPGASDELLARTVNRLQGVSLWTDDNASRCARVVSRFVDTWHEKLNTRDAETTGGTPAESGDSPRGAPAVSSISKARHHDGASSENTLTEPSPETTSSLTGFDYMFSLDQDTLFGPDFWQYLTDVQPDMNTSYTL